MNHESPVEDRLQALLGGSGLDLPARPDATGVIVGRVRRVRRRRRIVQTTVPVILTVAAIAGGLLISHRAEESPVLPSPTTLTASGIGGFRIGMTVPEARAAGLIGAKVPDSDPDCPSYPGTHEDVLDVSAKDGVIVLITVNAFADTPEGLHIGMTYADLQRVFGHRVSRPSSLPATIRVPLGDNGATRYTFGIGDGDVEAGPDGLVPLSPNSPIVSISLSRSENTCR